MFIGDLAFLTDLTYYVYVHDFYSFSRSYKTFIFGIFNLPWE